MVKRSLLVVALMVCLPATLFAQYDYVRISNPFLHKIPIAVPLFKPISGTEPEAMAAQSGADLLAATLEFTRYFNLINRAAFLERPDRTGVTLADIHCKNWRDIGAEFLITGGVTVAGGMVEMELRLFDVFKERMVLGKKYKGKSEDQRKMIHRFCVEVMEQLTGTPGIFESKIAFVSTGDGSKEIYACEFDGYNPQRITRNNSINLSPAWSSDGQWLAYTSYRKGGPDLYITNLTENRGTVFSKEGINISPSWVPGQFMLAATLSFEGDQEIYLLTGSGTVVRRLTRSWGIDVSPTFSPDGKRMAFVSGRAGSPQIFVMDMGSGRTQRLTFEGGYNTNPSWNPVNETIVYCAMTGGVFNIHVIDVKTGASVALTADQGDNESPSWSPDGSLIAFSSTREAGVPRIYVMTAAGTDPRRLLILPGEQTGPKWSPAVAAGR